MALTNLIEKWKADLKNLGDSVRNTSGKTELFDTREMAQEVSLMLNSEVAKNLISEDTEIITVDDLKNVTKICKGAFKDRVNLKEINIPNTVTEIEDDAFEGCVNLEAINIIRDKWGYSSYNGVLYYGGRIKYVPAKVRTSQIVYDAAPEIAYCYPEAFKDTQNFITIENGVKYFSNYNNTLKKYFLVDVVDKDLKELYIKKAETYYTRNNVFNDCKYLTVYVDAQDASSFDAGYGSYGRPIVWNSNNNEIAEDGYIYGITIDEINYAIHPTQNKAKVLRSKTTKAEVIIPDSIKWGGKTYTVFEINAGILADSINLESLTIPFLGVVKNFGDNNWTPVECHDTLHLGYLFGSSNYKDQNNYIPATLKDVIITNAVNLYDGSFYKCSNLESVILTNSNITTLPKQVFLGCTSLINVALPSNLQVIGESAFEGCNKLISVGTVPSTLTSISRWAFVDCASLLSINIPKTVTTMGAAVFARCDSLSIFVEFLAVSYIPSTWDSSWNYTGCPIKYGYSLINVDGLNYIIGGGSATVASQSYLIKSAKIPEKITYNNIEYPVTEIGWTAFMNCRQLASLDMSDSITYMAQHAFRNCFSLSDVKLSNNLTNISLFGLFNCKSLKQIDLPNSLKSIDAHGFEKCYYLKELFIPKSVTSIDKTAFQDCESLTIYVEKSGPDAIDTYSMYWNGLRFNFSNGYETSAYVYCPTYYNYNGEKGITETGFSWYREGSTAIIVSYNPEIKKSTVQIPNIIKSKDGEDLEVVEIKENLLTGCDWIEELTIPFVGAKKDNTKKTNFGYLFGAESRYQHETTIPEKLKIINIEASIIGDSISIDDGAFYNCKYIENVNMLNSNDKITKIGNLAFYKCSQLTVVQLPESGLLEVGVLPFHDCSKLSYTTSNNIKYLGNKKNPYIYLVEPTSRTTITTANINDGCKVIGTGAFLGSVLLNTVNIPNSVVGIGDYAFRTCSRLTNVNFGADSSLMRIGKEAFRDCGGIILLGGGISTITIPDTVKFIGRSAFKGCDKITSMTLPFIGRTSAENERHSHFGYIFGADSYSDQSNYVPSTLKTVSITNTKYIGDYAFNNCSSITSITLPNNLEYIGPNAFSGFNQSLGTASNNVVYIKDQQNLNIYALRSSDKLPSSITLDENCKFIASKAFSDCNQLRTIILSDALLDVGDDAFYNCSALTFTTDSYFKYLGSPNNSYLYCAGYIKLPTSQTTKINSNCKFIGSRSFMNASSSYLKYSLNSNIKSICSSAFESSYIGTLANSGLNLTRLGAYAFHNSDIKTGYLDVKIKHIGKAAFSYSQIESLNYLTGIKTLGEAAFGNCSNLVEVNGLADITAIPHRCFANCSNLEIIDLSASKIETIGSQGFLSCAKVNTIKLPRTLISISSDGAISDCRNLKSLYFDGTADQWVELDFIDRRLNLQGLDSLYLDGTLAQNVVLEKAYIINPSAFSGYKKLKSLYIPDTVMNIGNHACYGCSNLTEVIFSKDALYDYSQDVTYSGINISEFINSVDFNIGEIGGAAFEGTSIKQLILPTGVKKIVSFALPTVEELSCRAVTPPTLAETGTALSNNLKRINVVIGALSSYKSANVWSYYSDIIYRDASL